MKNLKEKFEQEYSDWRKETIFLSTGICSNEHYKNIVQMGIDAIPLIIEKIKIEPSFIVCALMEICPNVVTIEGYIGCEELCKIWIDLFKNNRT